MKPVKDSTLDAMEDLVPDCAKAIKAYLAYQGDNKMFHDKAKIAIGHVGSFAKTRSSETNRMQVELIAERTQERQQPRQLRAAR